MGAIGSVGDFAGWAFRQRALWRTARAGLSGIYAHAGSSTTCWRYESPVSQGGFEGDSEHPHGAARNRRPNKNACYRVIGFSTCVLAFLILGPGCAHAQAVNLNDVFGEGAPTVSGGILQVLLVLTILSVAPGILMMATCFTRFIVALSFLRAGLGLQTTPSNIILINLALFMTWFVMAPTFEIGWKTGLRPMMEGKLATQEAVEKMAQPFKTFMSANVREKDTVLFQGLVRQGPESEIPADGKSIQVLVPAFIVSELRRGFEIGFLIALPFLVIDIVVASIVMSMGMMMVSPIVFSLPLKVLFFVLIDGWSILVAALIKSYA